MRIIAIGAHLDDIEIASAGLIADAVTEGNTVKMLVMSKCNWQGEKNVRVRESKNAANILGVDDLEILDFSDGEIPYNSNSVNAIEKRVNEFKPDIILTHWPYDTHQDHQRVSHASISACRYYNKILLYEPMMPSGRSYKGFRNQFYYPVSREGVKKKKEALMAYKSQYKKYGKKVWTDAVQSRGRYRGYEISNDYAECFEVMRWELDL